MNTHEPISAAIVQAAHSMVSQMRAKCFIEFRERNGLIESREKEDQGDSLVWILIFLEEETPKYKAP